MFDLIIIGGGPAGVSAGVYAARKRLKTLLIAESIGGQSVVSPEIQNWIGMEKVSGPDLAKAFEAHVRAYAEDVVTLALNERAQNVEKTGENFTVKTTKNSYEARAVLIATGGSRRRLAVPGADQFEHKGLTYCASCDGPLFAGQDTVVVGGGNAGFETAAQLLAYAKSVTLIHRGKNYTADPSTVEGVLKHPNMKGVLECEPVEVRGEKFVESIVVRNVNTKEETIIPAAGIFVEIGMIPSTDMVKGVIALDQYGRVVTDAKTQRSSIKGIWAAGDCTDALYHQNNIAAGDAVKALEDIYIALRT